MWSVIATWPFSLAGVAEAAKMLGKGDNALNAVEKAIRIVESDPMVDCVGKGGFLNRDGELELDAAIMEGRSLYFGAVAAVSGYENPVSIARAVMEKTRHCFVAGDHAALFAREQGFREQGDLITPGARALWEKDHAALTASGHDTVGVVALDEGGDLVAGTSTSGAGMKTPGRVGDSPVIGSGFYADNDVGAATATGLGEDIMRCCTCFLAVELMRAGMAPGKAAEETVRRAHHAIVAHGGSPKEIALVCMNREGESGGAANHEGFYFATASAQSAVTLTRVTPVNVED